MTPPPSTQSERVVTVHVAIECIVHGDADTNLIAQTVASNLGETGYAIYGTHVLLRAIGLLRADEKYVNPRHDQIAS